MPDVLALFFDLTVEATNERSGDEPYLEITWMTAHEGHLQAYALQTPLLAQDFPARSGFAAGTRTLNGLIAASPLVPSEAVPWFAFAIRAREADPRTSAIQRRQDASAAMAHMEARLDPIVDGGRMPTEAEVFDAARTIPNPDRRGNDDDLIGTSIRVYPGLGRRFPDAPDGEEWFPDEGRMSFSGDDARWQMPYRLLHRRFR